MSTQLTTHDGARLPSVRTATQSREYKHRELSTESLISEVCQWDVTEIMVPALYVNQLSDLPHEFYDASQYTKAFFSLLGVYPL